MIFATRRVALRQRVGAGSEIRDGGQRLFIVPELDLTVVITAGAYNDPQIRRAVTEIFRQIVAAVRS